MVYSYDGGTIHILMIFRRAVLFGSGSKASAGFLSLLYWCIMCRPVVLAEEILHRPEAFLNSRRNRPNGELPRVRGSWATSRRYETFPDTTARVLVRVRRSRAMAQEDSRPFQIQRADRGMELRALLPPFSLMSAHRACIRQGMHFRFIF